MLTCPTEDFGHFVSITKKPNELIFERISTANVLTKARSARHFREGVQSFNLWDKTKHKVNSCGRMSHLFKDDHYHKFQLGENPSVLKLSWVPIDQIPEGLVYSYLHKTKDSAKIPMVYESGIICQDVFGYRIGYIVMEYCKAPALEFILKKGHAGWMDWKVSENLLKWFGNALTILGSVYVHGVIHHDILPKKLTVGKYFDLQIIDWGGPQRYCQSILSSTKTLPTSS